MDDDRKVMQFSKQNTMYTCIQIAFIVNVWYDLSMLGGMMYVQQRDVCYENKVYST